MSGIEIAGLVLGGVPVAFQAAIEAWRVLDDTISFDDDTEDLAIRLETAKAHLGLWAAKAGLTNGKWAPALVSLEELIEKILRRIGDLIVKVEQQGQKYGIFAEKPKQPDSRKVTATMIQMRRSLHTIITGSKTSLEKLLEEEASLHSKKFGEFITTLETHVSSLQKFAIEIDRKELQRDGTRLALEIVRGMSQPEALLLLQNVSGWDDKFSQIDVNSLAQWKSIELQEPTPTKTSSSATEDWSLGVSDDSICAQPRFLKKGRNNPEVIYLFEKKEYDSNIDDTSKDLLEERIQQLVSLLSDSNAQRKLHTSKAVGYVEDPDHYCWWIVFQFLETPMEFSELSSREPLSLQKLLSSAMKPALETRYRLAKRLVDSFARLYGSGWMHKGINSKNIVFPQIYSEKSSGTIGLLEKALVQGFNYSRQQTQAQTIDRGKVLNDLEAAIYRHPSYQGEAASGYQIHYDIYSLGLVLLEIAFWRPLTEFLGSKYRSQGKESSVAFHEAEALELKARVKMRVEQELAYRVGTKYRNMVEWCLNLEGRVTAMEFYDAIAVPIDELCS